jgi:hypothetical protein
MYQSRNDEASIHQPQRGYFIRMVTPLLVIFALLAVGVPRAMAQDAAGNTIFLPFVTNSGASVEVADESDENDVGNAFPQYVEPPPADGEVQAAIVNGQLVTSPPPWIAVGWRDSATDGGPWCTGTLIFSQWVISAGHCGALDGVRLGGTTSSTVLSDRSFFLPTEGIRILHSTNCHNRLANNPLPSTETPDCSTEHGLRLWAMGRRIQIAPVMAASIKLAGSG